MDLLKPRTKPAFALPEAIALAGFCLLAAWCIPHHESWFDEAQAWLIARDSTLSQLLLHRLHYEGAPALWHLLLWIEVRLHVSFLGMHYIAGLIAAAGAYVWLRYSPLPRIITLLVPFTYFLLYQYAVIARSYNLFPVLAFVLLALYQNRKSSPITFAIVAGLLANVSLHTAAFAGGAIIFYAADRWRLSKEGRVSFGRSQIYASAAILLFSFAISAFIARPTPDGSFGNAVIGAIGKEMPGASHAAKYQPPPTLAPPEPQNQGRIARAIWHMTYPAPNAGRKAQLLAKFVKRTLNVPTALTAPISTSNLLGVIFLALLAINLTRRRLWLSLLPYALVLAIFVLVYGESHHLGLLWISLLCSIWALSLGPITPSDEGVSWLRALYAVTLLIVVLQIGWSAHCINADLHGAYSPSAETADFLLHQPTGTRVAAFDERSIEVNAYLPSFHYINQPRSYWPYSKSEDPSLTIGPVLAERPDIVIENTVLTIHPFVDQWYPLAPPGTLDYDAATFRLLAQDGYHETNRFCGQYFYRNTSEREVCRVIFEPAASTASLSH